MPLESIPVGGRGRKREWTEGEVDLRSGLRDSLGQPHRESCD